jgi:aryl-alcohol dehydrogenase-like predicted oxidoreductase
MEYVRLFGSDLEVSRICLGGWQISGRSFGDFSDEQVRSIVHEALDAGINFFDVAPAYGRGHGEVILGKLLPRGSGVTLATKVGLRWKEDLVSYKDLSAASIIWECEQSLRRLGREAIDLYLVHWPHSETPLDESFDALDRLRMDGKVRHVGVCNYRYEELRAIRTGSPIVCLQSRLNLLERENLGDAAACGRSKLSFLAHSSLATGLLSGKYRVSAEFSDVRKRYEMYRGEGLRLALERVREFELEAAACGRSLLAHALRFVLDAPGVSVAVVGTLSSEQVRGVANAAFPT